MTKRDKILEDETLDVLLKGNLAVIQSKNGYRFSLDAILLAHFLTVRKGEQIVDLGTGSGVIPLILCFLHTSLQVTGIEIQAAMAERALRSSAWNGFEQRIRIVQGDVCSVEQVFSPQSFDGVTCNPPYLGLKRGRINPHPERRVARHEIRAALRDFLQAGYYLLREKGKMALIYPAERAVDLVEAMREKSLEPKRIQWVHSFASSEASLVLVEGIKGARSEVTVEAPLVVYEKPGIYTEEVKKFLEP
jgi:tRNA1Val (adenine37-N6)-methyltransferase